MFVGSLVLWAAAPYLMAIFSDDPEVIRIGAQYLRVDGFILPVYLVLFAMNSLLQALQKPIWTLWIGIFRQAIGVLLFVWLFVSVFNMGTLGVWLGIAVAVTLGLVMSIVVSAMVARDKIGGLIA
jgi:Na+-driven multidrug efflux pump